MDHFSSDSTFQEVSKGDCTVTAIAVEWVLHCSKSNGVLQQGLLQWYTGGGLDVNSRCDTRITRVRAHGLWFIEVEGGVCGCGCI